MDPLETFAVLASAGGTWLLAKNRPLGWWVGLVGIVVYAIVFYRVRLFAEVGILRVVENWIVWIAVDVIYIPLYASRGLYLTSVLYAAFLIMSIYGLINFLRIYRAQHENARPLAEAGTDQFLRS